jgi:uncharacterized protein (TIGR03083 family)
MMELARLAAELVAATERIAAIDAAVAPTRPVPTCPDWTFTDLLTHVGRAHRWAAQIIEQRLTAAIPLPSMVVPDERADWLLAGARQLTTAAAALGADGAVWTWSPDRTAGWWVRRMMHDTLIHRVDAEVAVGSTTPIPADLAADGVSDLLDTVKTLSPVPQLGKFQTLLGHGETLHLHATDPGLGEAGEWWITRGPVRVDWEHRHGKADVAVRGPARDLLLVLNRRLPPDEADLTMFGDEPLFAHWLANSAF